jgi:hypothetical protein
MSEHMLHQHPSGMQGKVLLDTLTSGSDLSEVTEANLDGCEAEDWPGFWGLEGPEYLAWLRRQTSTA